jgi:NitT/TauT family transport system substrate-binding protein
MTTLRIMVSRHSAFYSPLLATFSAGFLEQEGLQATYHVLPPGRNVGEFLASGEIEVAQSAVSYSWGVLEKGGQPPAVHFAQINQRDGFLIASRKPDPAFSWEKLLQGKLMYVHGGQPQAMLRYALHKRGVDLTRVAGINAGGTEAMLQAFRAGQGDYFHEQAPYPHQLEQEGLAQVVASVGQVIGPVAFSTLAATRGWILRREAAAFMRAYRKARIWVRSAAAAEVAGKLQALFPGIAREALVRGIECYQRLGCWDGDVTIDPAAYDVALDVFLHAGIISRRHPYSDVVTTPPAAV